MWDADITPHQVENSNLVILLHTSLPNKMCFDSSQNIQNSTLAITANNTWKDFFWCITQFSNIQKIVFLQALHIILQQKICFDSSEKVSICGQKYSYNHCIQYFKRKFVLMHHKIKISLQEKNSILYLPPPN